MYTHITYRMSCLVPPMVPQVHEGTARRPVTSICSAKTWTWAAQKACHIKIDWLSCDKYIYIYKYICIYIYIYVYIYIYKQLDLKWYTRYHMIYNEIFAYI